jgi:hypothetical protein
VAVSTAVAIFIVVSAIMIALATAWFKRERLRRLVGLSVNFGHSDGADSVDEVML